MAVPDMRASFTVYQPGFVITARELKWSLWNGNPKGRAGTIEKSNRKGSKLGEGDDDTRDGQSGRVARIQSWDLLALRG